MHPVDLWSGGRGALSLEQTAPTVALPFPTPCPLMNRCPLGLHVKSDPDWGPRGRMCKTHGALKGPVVGRCSGRPVSGLCSCLHPNLHHYPCHLFQVSAVLWVGTPISAWAPGGTVEVQTLGFLHIVETPARSSEEQSSLVVKKSLGSGIGTWVLSLTQHSRAV